ncbi:MAG: MBL fold metallo-hydrolase [Christensenellales bacterium]|jgi:7,8-dihydropterin-6-yl-methyl-4-(beta-D-ribofuranosyl)aminobenzene 5'-phosphate synthase
MKITILSENTTADERLECEHGLSVLVQMQNAVILFDTGCGGMFIRNAQKLGIDLAQVTHVILSHGHYDHAGGIPEFLSMNKTASVYMRKESLSPVFAVRARGEAEYIGVPQELADSNRLVFSRDGMTIAPGVTLYSDFTRSESIPETNRGLMRTEQGQLVPDDFIHEQAAGFVQGSQSLLLTGCSHHGIINIMRDYHQKTGGFPDFVLGGFHLHSHTRGKAEDHLIRHTAEYLAGTPSTYLTCHCTGQPSYDALKQLLGEQLQYASAGQTLSL